MRKMTLAICGIAAGVATLSACGSGGTTPTAGRAEPQPQVHTVADLAHLMASKTASVHTAHVQMTIATGTTGTITANGQIDLNGTDSKIQMNMVMPSIGTMQMELIGSTMYMELPKGLIPASVLPADKPWIRFDQNGTDPVSQELSAIVSQEQQNLDPTQAIAKLESVGTISKVGKDTVDGQPATRYAIEVDTQKLLASNILPAQTKALMQKVKLPKFFDYTMWLNSQQLPVKFVVSETISGQQVNVTAQYTDWGQPVSIQAPPASEVGTLSSK